MSILFTKKGNCSIKVENLTNFERGILSKFDSELDLEKSPSAIALLAYSTMHVSMIHVIIVIHTLLSYHESPTMN
jgi:hypothetical protein